MPGGKPKPSKNRKPGTPSAAKDTPQAKRNKLVVRTKRSRSRDAIRDESIDSPDDEQMFERITNELIQFQNSRRTASSHPMYVGMLIAFAAILALGVLLWIMQTAGWMPFLL